MLIREFLSDQPVIVSPHADIVAAARKMRDCKTNFLVVEETGKLCGVITDHDIACRALAYSPDCIDLTVRDIMSCDVIWCSGDDKLVDAALLMESNKVRQMPVVSSEGEAVGVLNLDDIPGKYCHKLACA